MLAKKFDVFVFGAKLNIAGYSDDSGNFHLF